MRVVVTPKLELGAEFDGMMSTNHRNAGGKVELRVAILNEALALRAHDVVREVKDARRGRRSGKCRHRRVVLGRIADCSEIKSRVLG